MSGGVEETFDLKILKQNKSTLLTSVNGFPCINDDIFWDILLNAKKKCSVIGCSIEVNGQVSFYFFNF